MNIIYTVGQIADIFGVSRQAIYNRINKMTVNELSTYCQCVDNKSKLITDKGFTYFQSVYSSKMVLNSSKIDFNDNSIVETLQNQIKSKDEQIKALNEQLQNNNNIINSLLEQNKNYQVLLQGQQVLSLPKKSILKRLFGKV